MSLLGIDIGTTSCKAAVFSDNGSLSAIAYREYQKNPLPAGHAELNSQKVLEDIWDSIAEVAGNSMKDPIIALSISSVGEAMTPVTADRKVIGNSILCSDTRGAEYMHRLSGQISQKQFYQINPNILGPNYSLPKLLWIRKNQPDLYNRAYKFLLWADLVTFMLGGDPVTSYSLANRTLLFDIRQEDWSEELLGLTGIERQKLPLTAASGTIAGTVCEEMAERLNLPKGVKIVVGGHDQCCNALGAGVFEQGKTVCGMGTFDCITPIYNSIPEDSLLFIENGLNVEHHVIPGHYASFLYNQSGSLVKWFRDTFASADKIALEKGKDIYDVLMAEIPEGATELCVLPHFEMTGPPKFISDSCGVIVGLKTTTTRGEILKAIMESTTFYFVEVLKMLKNMGIEISEFTATGGGAKSDAWLQIKADILGIPFKRLKQTECGLVGAAVIAGLATDIWSSPTQAISNFVQPEVVFEPDKVLSISYQQKYELYKELYPSFAEYLSSFSGKKK